ncbi:MAG: sodium:alanine symporter family protein [Clostridia bacterium]|nr:sodium:alanine symporter family protein [Clostridia bacterium]
MERIITDVLSPAVLFLLIITGTIILATARPHRVALCCMGKRKKKHGTSSISAMLTALAGTLGVGNISGVALAVSCGGVGAVFWMIVSSVFAMAVKYAEILLASHYRISRRDGFHGGAPLYIQATFPKKAGKSVVYIFTALCLFAALTVGCAVQSSATAEAADEALGVSPLFTGITLAAVCLFSVLGGAKRITKITDKLVPLISVGYLLLSLIIIIKEADQLPEILSSVIRSAFSLRPASAGMAGYGISSAIRYGVSRGLISNEAGCGTSPFAHARAEKEPAEQGLFGIAEVFIDTTVLCTATAICVIAAYDGTIPDNVGGMVLICNAYERYFGRFAPILLSIATALFAYGSMICWYFYGTECILLTGGAKTSKAVFTTLFAIFAVIGAKIHGGILWLASDVCFDLLLCVNTFTLLCRTKTVKTVTDAYVRSSSSSSAEIRRTVSANLSRGKAMAIPHSESEAP